MAPGGEFSRRGHTGFGAVACGEKKAGEGRVRGLAWVSVA